MSKYGKLRSHQAAAVELARLSEKKTIVAAVTPGGGKTLMAALHANELLDAGVVDRVVVACPRDSLRNQFVEGFHCPDRSLHRRLASEGNKHLSQVKMFSRACGNVTTYQAIVAAPEKHRRQVAGGRTLLVLDEPHHMAEDDKASWTRAVAPLVAAAERVLLMSGTLFRDGGERIPFVPYDDELRPVVDIEYTRYQALCEGAILPSQVRLIDATSSYEHRGVHKSFMLSQAPRGEQARALQNALADATWVDGLLTRALDDWTVHQRKNWESKAIVVVRSQLEARRVMHVLQNRYPGATSVLAISDEPDARAVLQKFRQRKGRGDILVTVDMACEGLDVPSATHLVYLSDKRTRGYLDQVLARVTRNDAECGAEPGRQVANVYMPRDAASVGYVATMLEEQDRAARDIDRRDGEAPRKGFSSFKRGDAEGHVLHLADVTADGPQFVSSEDAQLVDYLRRRHPVELGSRAAHEILKAFEGLRAAFRGDGSSRSETEA